MTILKQEILMKKIERMPLEKKLCIVLFSRSFFFKEFSFQRIFISEIFYYILQRNYIN